MDPVVAGDRIVVTRYTESYYGNPIPEGTTATVLRVFTDMKRGWILLRLDEPIKKWVTLSVPIGHVAPEPGPTEEEIQTAVQSIATSIRRTQWPSSPEPSK